MEKNRFFLKSDLPIGKDAPTALNILIGANTQSQMKEEKAKINALIGSRLPISIITDLSLFSSDKEQPLWKIVAEDGRCVPGTVPVYQAVDNNGCLACNVNVIIETPGHVAPQGIFQLCDYLLQSCQHPIMPLGPMPTDCAFDEDDSAATIGAVLMGTRGCADILSVVTKDEHLGGIPSIESIIRATKKYAIAKHIIDIYKTNDISADYSAALIRSKNTSCIVNSKDCTRCNNLCPLKTKLWE